MTPSFRKLALTCPTVLTAAVLFAACGGDDATIGSPDPGNERPAAAGLEHVHGLGINPRDDALIIATHTGLFRAGKSETRARAYGDSRQDVMGFSILGPDRFIGSGHPDPRDTSSPPNLGLIRSRDGGRSFEPVSLRGEADFHVLESRGEQVYGFDGTQARLMVSRDGGRRWTQRTPPAAMLALAIDPTDGARIVAATAAGLRSSSDEGRTWKPLAPALIGLLAWPGAERLYLLDGAGGVQLSTDRGRSFRSVGSVGGQPAAFMASGDELYAALHDGTVKRSADGGRTWQVRATP
ncbi:MAG: exo-alpha-sialidase [Solirubrobacterales bacterium]|nr:exo-alpha-sialidase [Solirubrobacterales bacterium]